MKARFRRMCRGLSIALVAAVVLAAVPPPVAACSRVLYVAKTIWRTVSDSTSRVVLFDSALSPATFWVRLDDLDLKPGAPAKKLELVGGKSYSGNAADKFVEARLFAFESLGGHFQEPKK